MVNASSTHHPLRDCMSPSYTACCCEDWATTLSRTASHYTVLNSEGRWRLLLCALHVALGAAGPVTLHDKAPWLTVLWSTGYTARSCSASTVPWSSALSSTTQHYAKLIVRLCLLPSAPRIASMLPCAHISILEKIRRRLQHVIIWHDMISHDITWYHMLS